MKKSVIIYATVLLVCFGPVLSVRAVPVDDNDVWQMVLDPGESFTCLAHFIPDIPNVVPESLIFTQPPEWTSTYPSGWDTALTDAGKTAYLFGPEITNSGPDPNVVFKYNLCYQWDDEAHDFDPNYPIYLDWVVFDDLTLTEDLGWRKKIDGTWEWPADEITWREQYYPGSDPYETPVPEPMTICLLGLGTAFLEKRRR